jgi:hypothetical protein
VGWLPTPLSELEGDLQLRVEFERRAGQLTTERPSSEFEWYFLMQHYGAPTRLLDWTDGALIALYFAVQSHVEDDDYGNEDAAVWVLDPLRLNHKSLGTPERPDVPVLTPHSSRAQKYMPKVGTRTTPIPKSPIAIDPPHVSKRLAVQRSRFVLFGSNQDGIETVMRGDDRLTKITIDAQSCKMIYRDLLTCGLSRNTLFPDLEGLGGELARAWRVNSLYR